MLEHGVQESGRADGVDQVHPYEPRVLPGGDVFQLIADVYGSRVQGFGLRAGLLGEQRKRYGFFNGVRTGKTIFLRDSGLDRPHLAVLGHELVHELKTKYPDLYRNFADAIRPYVDQAKYAREFTQSPAAAGMKSADDIQEEFLGEVMSDAFMDPEFWRLIALKRYSLLQRVASYAVKMIDKVLAAVPYTKRAAPYLTDLKRAREIAVEAMVKFAQAGAAQKAGPLRFQSASDGTDRSEWGGFSQAVDRAIDRATGADVLRQATRLSDRTPAVLRLVGVEDRPVVTSLSMLRKMHDMHGVARSVLKRLPELLADPVMVLKSRTAAGRLVVVTDHLISGNPLILVVDPNGESGNLRVTFVPSAYPKDGGADVFVRDIKAGGVLYANKAKSRQLATTAGLQLPGVVRRAVGFSVPKCATEADLPVNGDTRFSITAASTGLVAPANQVFSHLAENSAPDGRLHWWHKTVGMMNHLAEKSPPFKRVYEAVQSFIQDSSRFAAEAADLAPDVLIKLDKLRDIWKSPMSASDGKMLSKTVFHGTLLWTRDAKGKPVLMSDVEALADSLDTEQKVRILMRNGKLTPDKVAAMKANPLDVYDGWVRNQFDAAYLKPGIVFTPAELKQHFGATDAQIKHYQQFRAAVDRSITSLAVSDMIRVGGKPRPSLRTSGRTSSEDLKTGKPDDFLRDIREGDVLFAHEGKGRQLATTAGSGTASTCRSTGWLTRRWLVE